MLKLTSLSDQWNFNTNSNHMIIIKATSVGLALSQQVVLLSKHRCEKLSWSISKSIMNCLLFLSEVVVSLAHGNSS